jgi:hypothetical protein
VNFFFSFPGFDIMDGSNISSSDIIQTIVRGDIGAFPTELKLPLKVP